MMRRSDRDERDGRGDRGDRGDRDRDRGDRDGRRGGSRRDRDFGRVGIASSADRVEAEAVVAVADEEDA